MIADRLGSSFLKGDAFPPASIAKMSSGIALQDEDRWPWLDALGRALGAAARERGRSVAACSALTRAYRDRLAVAAGMKVRFVHLAGTRALLAARLALRADHFMPPSLLGQPAGHPRAALAGGAGADPGRGAAAGGFYRPCAGVAGRGARKTALVEHTRRGTRRRHADRPLHDTPG
jgi:hypothetical protein